MLLYNCGIQKPKNPEDFEDVCHIIYRRVFQDEKATKNGRSGQKQHGVDIYIRRDERLIGIQCKRKKIGRLTDTIIKKEVASADAGALPITELIIATTADNDAPLIQYVERLSDEREKEGRFRVTLAFWDTLESFIREHPSLQVQFAPHMPGGAFFKLEQDFQEIKSLIIQYSHPTLHHLYKQQIETTNLAGISSIAIGRNDSLNKVITIQLDEIRKSIVYKGCYVDALQLLTVLSSTFGDFDDHQRARWYSLRGFCYWRMGEKKRATTEYDTAYKLAPDDDKISSNQILALLLKNEVDEAVTFAKDLVQRFPSSAAVWVQWSNAMQVANIPVNLNDIPLELHDKGDIQQGKII